MNESISNYLLALDLDCLQWPTYTQQMTEDRKTDWGQWLLWTKNC